ncbi:hypothetical protein CerSpe_046570 [Prunus speciosa]
MEDPKEPVCQSYFFLKPEETSFLELLRLLCSSDVGKRRFIEIECSEEDVNKVTELRRRWVIFISVVLQWSFLFFRDPLARTGDVFDKWLNLISANGGLLKLFINRLKGKVVKPADSFTSKLSVVGNVDWRIELDDNIKPEDTRYKGALSMMAAKWSYENEDLVRTVVNDHWKMKFLRFYNFWNDYLGRDSTQAFLFQDTTSDPNLIVVAFRGTEPFDADEWSTDLDISWCEFSEVGKAHSGFMKALGMQPNNTWPLELKTEQVNVDQPHRFAYYTIGKKLIDLLQENKSAKFILTGHSLGGPLAVMFAAVLAMHGYEREYELLVERLEGVYTFGQPRVGDAKFGEYMKEKLQKYGVRYMRYVYSNDLVPRIPYDDKTLFFKHFGPSLYFNSCYKGKVLEEEPNKNYFNPLWFIPKRLNAVWELIRSFILPLRRGSEYKEAWFMRALRVVGLILPGLVAHAPQDYVNLTRLGSLPSLANPNNIIPQENSKVD